jgi:hypothetical protein
MENRIKLARIYSMLWDILSLYEETERYNKLPNGVQNIDIWDYLSARLMEVRKTADTLYLARPNTRKKLHLIIDETEVFVRSYEVPGVVKRWKQINPKILFFEGSFDLIEDDFESYKKICRGLSNLKLDCYPDEELCKMRKEYFEEIKNKNESNNLRYSEERIFQNELINTLTLVFEHDFNDELTE